MQTEKSLSILLGRQLGSTPDSELAKEMFSIMPEQMAKVDTCLVLSKYLVNLNFPNIYISTCTCDSTGITTHFGISTYGSNTVLVVLD